MPYSTLIAGAYTVTFRADDRYSTTWNMFKAVSVAYQDGRGALGWGGYSLTELDLSGILITNLGGDGSADKQIFATLLPLVRDAQRTELPAVCTLQLGNGTVILTGWVRNFMVDRDAPEGEELVRVSFNMLLEEFPDHSGLV